MRATAFIGAGRRRVGRSILSAVVSVVAASGCSAEPVAVKAPMEPASRSVAGAFPPEERPLKRFHSSRFKLWLPLPDGRSWRIDDHTRPVLVATHAATSSSVTVWVTTTAQLVNRQACEAEARGAGLVRVSDVRTVDDQITVTPEGFDARVWVALEPGGKPGVPLVGHVFEFGAYVHKCLFVHFRTEVSSDKLEDFLSARLATARTMIVGGLSLPPFDEVPREKPPDELRE